MSAVFSLVWDVPMPAEVAEWVLWSAETYAGRALFPFTYTKYADQEAIVVSALTMLWMLKGEERRVHDLRLKALIGANMTHALHLQWQKREREAGRFFSGVDHFARKVCNAKETDYPLVFTGDRHDLATIPRRPVEHNVTEVERQFHTDFIVTVLHGRVVFTTVEAKVGDIVAFMSTLGCVFYNMDRPAISFRATFNGAVMTRFDQLPNLLPYKWEAARVETAVRYQVCRKHVNDEGEEKTKWQDGFLHYDSSDSAMDKQYAVGDAEKLHADVFGSTYAKQSGPKKLKTIVDAYKQEIADQLRKRGIDYNPEDDDEDERVGYQSEDLEVAAGDAYDRRPVSPDVSPIKRKREDIDLDEVLTRSVIELDDDDDSRVTINIPPAKERSIDATLPI